MEPFAVIGGPLLTPAFADELAAREVLCIACTPGQDGDWYIAYSPEVPGANGQGLTSEEALASLRDAIALILEDRREDGLRGVPADALRETVVVE